MLPGLRDYARNHDNIHVEHSELLSRFSAAGPALGRKAQRIWASAETHGAWTLGLCQISLADKNGRRRETLVNQLDEMGARSARSVTFRFGLNGEPPMSGAEVTSAGPGSSVRLAAQDQGVAGTCVRSLISRETAHRSFGRQVPGERANFWPSETTRLKQ